VRRRDCSESGAREAPPVGQPVRTTALALRSTRGRAESCGETARASATAARRSRLSRPRTPTTGDSRPCFRKLDISRAGGKIDDFIIASIRKSALLVADFTGTRTGVFFEAGLGMGLGIPVVWTCREDYRSELEKHFDTRQYNHLLWENPPDLCQKLKNRIEATVHGRPRPRETV